MTAMTLDNQLLYSECKYAFTFSFKPAHSKGQKLTYSHHFYPNQSETKENQTKSQKPHSNVFLKKISTGTRKKSYKPYDKSVTINTVVHSSYSSVAASDMSQTFDSQFCFMSSQAKRHSRAIAHSVSVLTLPGQLKWSGKLYWKIARPSQLCSVSWKWT